MALLDALFAPQSFAPGGEQIGLLQRLLAGNQLAPVGMMQQGAPAMFPPTDVSAAAVPPQAPPAAPAPALAPPPAAIPGLLQPNNDGGIFGGIGNWIQQNSLPLMMLGAGIASGKTWGEGIGKGLAGAAGVKAKTNEQQTKLQMQQQAYKMLVAQGVDPQKAMLAVMNPEAAKAAGVLGEKQRTIVSPGATVIGPDNKPLFTAPKESTKTDLEKRAEAAGLVPGSQEYRDFMLRGGRNADAPLSATDKKAVFEAEDALPQIKNTITALERAKELNGKTFSGFGASTLGSIGTKLPGGGLIVDENRARATQEWEKIMAPEALQTMANTLKGATTDFELKKFIEMLGDPAVDPAIRQSMIDRMLTLARRKLELQEARIRDLRGGTYFKPGGGALSVPSAPTQSAVPPPPPGFQVVQ